MRLSFVGSDRSHKIGLQLARRRYGRRLNELMTLDCFATGTHRFPRNAIASRIAYVNIEMRTVQLDNLARDNTEKEFAVRRCSSARARSVSEWVSPLHRRLLRA